MLGVSIKGDERLSFWEEDRCLCRNELWHVNARNVQRKFRIFSSAIIPFSPPFYALCFFFLFFLLMILTYITFVCADIFRKRRSIYFSKLWLLNNSTFLFFILILLSSLFDILYIYFLIIPIILKFLYFKNKIRGER